jgi:hypothetical protein
VTHLVALAQPLAGYGRNGNNVINATAATQAEAWRLAAEQARAVRMLRGGR